MQWSDILRNSARQEIESSKQEKDPEILARALVNARMALDDAQEKVCIVMNLKIFSSLNCSKCKFKPRKRSGNHGVPRRIDPCPIPSMYNHPCKMEFIRPIIHLHIARLIMIGIKNRDYSCNVCTRTPCSYVSRIHSSPFL